MSFFKIFTANEIYTFPNNMNTKSLLAVFTIGLLYTSCKTSGSASVRPAASQATSSTVKQELLDPSTQTVAEKRWPGTSASDLLKGHSIFISNCAKCHDLPKIEIFSERKWIHEIDEMAPKAELTAAQKDLLSKYVLSFREAHSTNER
jgi:cytochrome c5